MLESPAGEGRQGATANQLGEPDFTGHLQPFFRSLWGDVGVPLEVPAHACAPVQAWSGTLECFKLHRANMLTCGKA